MNREQKNELSRQKILQAALEEFGENDYGVASTNRICKNHHISKGLLFHYYQSKEALFLVCVDHCFDALRTYLEQNCIIDTASSISMEDQLNEYFRIRFEFFNKYPYYEQIFNTATFYPPTHLREQIEALRENLRSTNRKFLLGVLENVALKQGIDKELVIEMILEFGEYLQLKYQTIYNNESRKDTKLLKRWEKDAETKIKMLFYGILA